MSAHSQDGGPMHARFLGGISSPTGRLTDTPPELQDLRHEPRADAADAFALAFADFSSLERRVITGFDRATGPDSTAYWARTEFKRRVIHRGLLYLRHKASGKTALGQRGPGGTVLVQFDDLNHPHSHGWTAYPRHHFIRRRF